MLAFKSYHSVEKIALDGIDAETTWTSVLVNKCQKLVIGVFYRQPDHRTHWRKLLSKLLLNLRTTLTPPLCSLAILILET